MLDVLTSLPSRVRQRDLNYDFLLPQEQLMHISSSHLVNPEMTCRKHYQINIIWNIILSFEQRSKLKQKDLIHSSF